MTSAAIDELPGQALTNEWLSGIRRYEEKVRNVAVKDLCNRQSIEQLRYDLRALLDYVERLEKTK